jgi:hypothetical protein
VGSDVVKCSPLLQTSSSLQDEETRSYNVAPRVVLNKEISVDNKTKYVYTNMVRSEMYNCGSKRLTRWGKIGKLGLVVNVMPWRG